MIVLLLVVYYRVVRDWSWTTSDIGVSKVTLTLTPCQMLLRKIPQQWTNLKSFSTLNSTFQSHIITLTLLKKLSFTMFLLWWFYRNRCCKLNGGIFINNYKFLKMVLTKLSLKTHYDISFFKNWHRMREYKESFRKPSLKGMEECVF